MKITRSALKNLIKEEMNRINEVDEPTVHPYSYGDLPDDLKVPFAWTNDDIGEKGALLSTPLSIRWPADDADPDTAVITMVTRIRPLDDTQRKTGSDAMFTGRADDASLIGGSTGMAEIAAAVKKSNPELWALIVKAKEGARLYRQGKAKFVDGGWTLVEPARTFTSSGD